MADATAARRRPPEPNWATRAAVVAALLLALFALIFVLATSLGDGDDATAPAARQGERAGAAKDGGAVNPKTYAVEEGDTLSHIADKFDVSVKRLRRLNPDIDPQILATGQELTIR